MNATKYAPSNLENVTLVAAATAKTVSPTTKANVTAVVSYFDSKMIIPLYVVIFLLSVVGNMMVLCTLFRNRRMRTVTNVYLVNLAVSDLLLGVFCMPFTLVGQVLRNFIFGSLMCRLIPYFQAVCVSVAVWTLVAISLERYFAICRPLKSRRWQTQFHAYKMICFVWTASLLWSAPVLIVSTLKAMKQKGTFKCREEWPSIASERAFNLILDGLLLILPLIIMTLAYSLIVGKLWKRLQKEIHHNNSFHQDIKNNIEMKHAKQVNNRAPCEVIECSNGKAISQHQKYESNSPIKFWIKNLNNVQCETKPLKCNHSNITMSSYIHTSSKTTSFLYSSEERTSEPIVLPASDTNSARNDAAAAPAVAESVTFQRMAIRSTYIGKSIEAKKKVIRMLFVIVLEFFICWTPIHILNTWYLFCPEIVYNMVGPTGIALVQLLAYISSCCNPITYCFMNRKFRQSFFTMFYPHCICCTCTRDKVAKNERPLAKSLKIKLHNSDGSGNESTIYPGQVSILGRSEIVVLEGEERV